MESTNAKRGDDLVVDLANIVNSPAFGDVILISREGDRLWACRILLAARSPVFESMFMNGVTVEATNLEIPLPSISTSALLPVLEFIYTGTLSKYSISLQNSVNVIYASRYLLLFKLEELAISFLCAQSPASLLDGLGDDLSKHLSEAVDMLSPDLDHEIFTLFVDAINRTSPSVENVKGFSDEAMRVYLNMTQTNGMRPSASEYKWLRCLLIWCALSISVSAARVLCLYLPAEQPKVTRSSYDLEEIAGLLSACKPYLSSLAVILEPWKSKVNFFRIHPKVLAGFIEPLGIVEPTHLLRIFQFHAVFGKELSLLQWTGGAHPSHFSILDEGSVIEGSSQFDGYAATAAPITSMSEVCEWDFVIERDCHFMGLGFCSAHALMEGQSLNTWLGDNKHGWVICCTGCLYHDCKPLQKNVYHPMSKSNEGARRKVPYTSEFGEGARINVRLCMEKHTCEFKIDNRVCGVAWNNIPSQVYPAVTMRFPGRVRIESAQHNEIKTFMETVT